MNVFDSAKEKLGQVMGENADKVEEVSDQALDKGVDIANERGAGKYAEQVNQARDAADEKIGSEPRESLVNEDAPDADPEQGAVPPLGG